MNNQIVNDILCIWDIHFPEHRQPVEDYCKKKELYPEPIIEAMRKGLLVSSMSGKSPRNMIELQLLILLP